MPPGSGSPRVDDNGAMVAVKVTPVTIPKTMMDGMTTGRHLDRTVMLMNLGIAAITITTLLATTCQALASRTFGPRRRCGLGLCLAHSRIYLAHPLEA